MLLLTSSLTSALSAGSLTSLDVIGGLLLARSLGLLDLSSFDLPPPPPPGPVNCPLSS